MSESPFYPYRAPTNPAPKPEETDLASIYQLLRLEIDSIEKLLDNENNFDDKSIKRLDKAVTLLKIGSKVIKKILKEKGFAELKPKAMCK